VKAAFSALEKMIRDIEDLARIAISLWNHQPTNRLNYTDKKCPFTGLVSIRGRILTGRVVSTKMHRTIVIRREYLHYVPKYNRYEKRHKNLAAHVSPAFRVEEGDWVTVGQCRPLSKTVRFKIPNSYAEKSIPNDGTGGCGWLVVLDFGHFF
jgi:ribosomal protein uS17